MERFRIFDALSLELKTSEGTALLIADPHIGFERERGVRIRSGFEGELAEFILEKDPDLLVLLGDVKDPIGLDPPVRHMLEDFFSGLRDMRVVVIKGNHDGRIEEVAERYGVTVLSHMVLDDLLFIHGHTRLPEVEFSEAYLGHVHPVHVVSSGGVQRRVKVFARAGRFLILPTINPYLDGFTIAKGIRMVPFLSGVRHVDVFLPSGVYLGRVTPAGRNGSAGR
ncbi:MAG: exonuclease SbcD [Thermococci archaeon]|nr:exonuclease SbcD [Thermococci archaeon]